MIIFLFNKPSCKSENLYLYYYTIVIEEVKMFWIRYINEKVKEVIDNKIICVSLLQRKLNCGYVSAKSLYDKMVEKKIIEHIDSYQENIINPVKARSFLKKEYKKILKNFNILKENNYFPSVEPVFFENSIGYDFISAIITGNLLIGGATGSGKTNLLNNIICEIVSKYKKEDFNIILADPKEIEYGLYSKLPHLIYPIVKKFKSFIEMSKLIEIEVMNRQKLFRKKRVKNIFEYNYKFYKKKLPFIIIIMDEIADYVCQDRYSVEQIMKNIFNCSIDYGVSVVCATQAIYMLPEAIKDNLNYRCCFKTVSAKDSKTILEEEGAESLEERGCMIINNLKKQKSCLRHCDFLTKDTIKQILENSGNCNI